MLEELKMQGIIDYNKSITKIKWYKEKSLKQISIHVFQ